MGLMVSAGLSASTTLQEEPIHGVALVTSHLIEPSSESSSRDGMIRSERMLGDETFEAKEVFGGQVQ
jgi:hypothetical protein